MCLLYTYVLTCMVCFLQNNLKANTNIMTLHPKINQFKFSENKDILLRNYSTIITPKKINNYFLALSTIRCIFKFSQASQKYLFGVFYKLGSSKVSSIAFSSYISLVAFILKIVLSSFHFLSFLRDLTGFL